MTDMKDYSVAFKEGFYEQGIKVLSEKFEEAGVVVTKAFPEINAVYVNASEQQAEQIRALETVERVRSSGHVQLPPMSPSIPQ